MQDYQQVFIINLKKIRNKSSLTQAQLAELCDISNGTIGNIECGITKPSFDLILKFAKVLEVSPACFFEEDNKKNQISKKILNNLEKNIHNTISNEFEKIIQ